MTYPDTPSVCSSSPPPHPLRTPSLQTEAQDWRMRVCGTVIQRHKWLNILRMDSTVANYRPLKWKRRIDILFDNFLIQTPNKAEERHWKDFLMARDHSIIT